MKEIMFLFLSVLLCVCLLTRLLKRSCEPILKKFFVCLLHDKWLYFGGSLDVGIFYRCP